MISVFGRKVDGGQLTNVTKGGDGQLGVRSRYKNRKRPEWVRRKIVESRKDGGNGIVPRMVLDNSTGIFYDSIKEAALVFGIKEKTLWNYLSGCRKNKTNLIWL